MNSQKKPAGPKKSSNLTCKICSIKCTSRSCLEQHFRGGQHKRKIQLLQSGVIGHLPTKRVIEKIFNNPNRKGAVIGLQFLKAFLNKKKNPYYICCLCGAGSMFSNILEHLCGAMHKKNYIIKSLPFVGREKLDQPHAPIEKIAEAIEATEGLSKYNEAFPNFQKSSSCTSLDGSVRQIGIDSLETLTKDGMMHCNPHSEGNTQISLESGLHRSGPLYKKQSEHDELNHISSSLDASSSVHFSMDDQICDKYPSLPVVKDAEAPSTISLSCTTGSFVSKNSGMTKTYSSHIPVVSPTFVPSVHHSFPYTKPGGSSYQHVVYDHDGFTPPGNIHVSPDANSLFIAEVKDQSRRVTPTHVKEIKTVENICHSSSSIACSSRQCCTDDCSGQSSSSLFCGNSTSIGTFASTSPLPIGSTSVLQELPCTVSSGYNPLSQVSTSSSVEVKYNSLTPDILKILRGKDVATVNTILNRLAGRCPQLQKVNISMLVDVLFEAGALS